MAGPTFDLDLASVFLGPKAENADIFERLLLEAFRDHVFWRRNFHPEDGFSISEIDRRREPYQESLSRLSQELLGLLGELKGGVPFFSPRHIGHMSSDSTMAAMVGYFATMLYNPNNVSAEASPVTTRLELEVGAELARMLGYPEGRDWSHLTSGGTVANFEALWVARNVKYLPVSVRWAAEELGCELPIARAGGERDDVRGLDLWALLNVGPREALDAAERLRGAMGQGPSHDALSRWSLASLGAQEFERKLKADFGDPLPPGVVLVPSTAHYSWEKICRALGIGAAQVRRIPVDRRFRMDVDALGSALCELGSRRQPVIACVSAIGTTEESAVDRLDLVAELRERAASESGLSFYLHADAAWGGYAATITRGRDGQRRTLEAARADYAPEDWPSPEVFAALCALGRTDSATVDPHKLGFAPYPAGAICFRDRRVRDLVAVEAPYAFASEGERTDLGRFIFEGSKPGAAAAGVWLSHRVLPLHAGGYGRLIGETARGARRLHRALAEAAWAPFRCVLLPETDLNIVCFAFAHPKLGTLEENNAFIQRVHAAMSPVPSRPARHLDYFVSKTLLRADEYGEAGEQVALQLGYTAGDYRRAGGIAVLRSAVMNPEVAAPRGRVDFLAGFVRQVAEVLEQQLFAPDAARHDR